MSLVTFRFSDLDMDCQSAYYGGPKEGRIKHAAMGGARMLSHIRSGDLQQSTFDFEISDYDGLISGWLASQEYRFWTRPLTVRMGLRDDRRHDLPAWIVFNGPIVDAQKRSRPPAWTITLGDRVSQGLLTDDAQVPWRRIGDGFLSQFTKVADDLDREAPEPIIYGIHRRFPSGAPSGQGLVFKPLYLGIMDFGDGDEHTWLVAGHACADVPDQFVDEVSSVAFTVRNGIDLVSDTFGNLRRYTLVTGAVTDPGFLDPDVEIDHDTLTEPDACALGEKTLTLWVEGVEPVGDGSGTVITKRFLQYKHFLINYVANQNQNSYQSGAWLTNPVWTIDEIGGPVEIPIVDEDSFDAADAIGFERFPTDDGYTGAGILDTRQSVKDWIAAWNRSGNCRFGVTHKGQLRIVMFHPTTAIKAAAPTFTDALHIIEGTFEPNVLWEEHTLVVPFLADFNHVTQKWMTTSAATATDLLPKYENQWKPTPTREYHFAPGITNSWHIAAIELLVFQHPPRMVTFETDLLTDAGTAAMLELGDYFNYQHFAAIGTAPRQTRLAQVVGHQVLASDRRVRLIAIDCEDFVDFDLPGAGGDEDEATLNDRCERAREFTVTEELVWQRYTQDTTPNTEDTSIAALIDTNSPKHPAWFKFTAPADGNLSVTTSTSGYDTVLYCLRGTCGGAWEIIGQGDDEVGINAAATVDLEFGDEVYILIVGKTDADFGYLLAQASFGFEEPT